MGYTVNSIIIKKEINELFEIINDVRNWPELHNYQDVKILERERLFFKLRGIKKRNRLKFGHLREL